MTVQELIEKLEKCDKEAMILVDGDRGYYELRDIQCWLVGWKDRSGEWDVGESRPRSNNFVPVVVL